MAVEAVSLVGPQVALKDCPFLATGGKHLTLLAMAHSE